MSETVLEPVRRRTPFSDEERAAAIDIVCEKLSQGIPLAVICREPGMPNNDTIYDWKKADAEVERRIAHARELGFDVIADDALRIADTQELGEIRTHNPDGTVEVRMEDMLGHRRLQIETRLKLLAKWCPKKYGETGGGNTVNVAVAVGGLSEERRSELMAKRKLAIEGGSARPEIVEITVDSTTELPQNCPAESQEAD